MPSRIAATSAGVSDNLRSSERGTRKQPRSSFLYTSTNPPVDHTSSFSAFPLRFLNHLDLVH